MNRSTHWELARSQERSTISLPKEVEVIRSSVQASSRGRKEPRLQQAMSDNKKSAPAPTSFNGSLRVIGWLALCAVTVLAFWLLWITLFDDDSQDEELRTKAEAVLEARFNDTSDTVGPLVSMEVYWEDDVLMVDWVQGETAQKSCTAPVVVSDDEQQFGIEKFDAVPFDEQDSANATCLTTSGLEFGLPNE